MGKFKDIVHGGPHHTETANKLDPQVAGGRGPIEHATVEGADSRPGESTGMTGGHRSTTGVTSGQSLDSSIGLAGGHGATTGTTAGPHSSNLANKADPRVDSDSNGKRALEMEASKIGTTVGHERSGHPGFGSSATSRGGHGSSTVGSHTVSAIMRADTTALNLPILQWEVTDPLLSGRTPVQARTIMTMVTTTMPPPPLALAPVPRVPTSPTS